MVGSKGYNNITREKSSLSSLMMWGFDVKKRFNWATNHKGMLKVLYNHDTFKVVEHTFATPNQGFLPLSFYLFFVPLCIGSFV